mmetsp:Transcript_20861/g.48078  ORF Transcript_20861/g.48078 Transcript_20861/m.48078 type:complete len:230 (+) Transcript_20861:985-1674(+)
MQTKRASRRLAASFSSATRKRARASSTTRSPRRASQQPTTTALCPPIRAPIISRVFARERQQCSSPRTSPHGASTACSWTTWCSLILRRTRRTIFTAAVALHARVSVEPSTRSSRSTTSSSFAPSSKRPPQARTCWTPQSGRRPVPLSSCALAKGRRLPSRIATACRVRWRVAPRRSAAAAGDEQPREALWRARGICAGVAVGGAAVGAAKAPIDAVFIQKVLLQLLYM